MKRHTSLSIFVLALMARLIHLAVIYPTVFYRQLTGDGLFFLRYAHAIANGTIQDQVLQANFSPVYLGFLTFFYHPIGDYTLLPRLVQILFGSLACLCLYRIAENLWNQRAAVAVGVMSALYGIFIYYDAEIRKGSLVNSLLITALYFLVLIAKNPKWFYSLLAGICFSTAMAMRMNLFLFFPVILAWILCVHFPKRKLQSLIAVLLICGATALNIHLWKQWTSKTIPETDAFYNESGLLLYIGNNPEAEGAYTVLPDIHPHPLGHTVDANRVVEGAIGHKPTEKEFNQYWMSKTFDYIASNPVDWLVLEAKKFFLSFNAYEIPHDENVPFVQRYTYFLSLPLFAYALIAPLGLTGLLFWRGSWRHPTMLLILFFIVYLVTLLITFVSVSYRLPLHIPLILFSGFAIDRVAQCWNAQKMRQLTRVGLVFFVLYLFTNYNTFIPKYAHDFTTVIRYRDLARQIAEKQGTEPEHYRHWGSPFPGIMPGESLEQDPLGRARALADQQIMQGRSRADQLSFKSLKQSLRPPELTQVEESQQRMLEEIKQRMEDSKKRLEELRGNQDGALGELTDK